MPTRSITDPKASQRLEEFAERLPEALAEGNARRKDASPTSLLDEQRLQSTELVQDAGIARRERLEEVGTLGGWKRAFDTTTTGHLVDSGLAKLMLDEEADPSWRMTVPDYNELLNAHGLQGSEHVFDRLNTATSADQANRMATSLKKQQVALEELDGHGVKVFLASAMDPVENATMIAAAAATRGIAAPLAMGVRAERVAYATSQVGALVGTMQAGRAAGAEYTAEDLLLTGAVGGLLSYRFAPAWSSREGHTQDAPGGSTSESSTQQGAPDTEYSLSGVGGSAARGLDTSRIGARNLVSADLDTVRYREVAALRDAQVPAETLETLRSTLGDEVFSGMQRSEHIHFVQSAEQLPEAARHATDSYFYDTLTDTLFIIADRLTPENAAQTVLGGVGVRLGLERTLGTSTYDTVLDSLQKLADSGDALAKDALQKATGRDYLQAEDALARYLSAGGSLDTNLFRTILAKLKVYLQDTFGITTELGREDLLALVQSSASRTLRKDNIDAEASHVWSGSAAQFEQFDSRYIGTGEGNILQGWGTYTTTNKHTAGWYRAKETSARGKAPSQGGLYRIPLSKVKTSDFLSWGARAQSPKVKKILRKHGLPSNLTGEELYRHILTQMPGETPLAKAKATSEYLHSIGIKGTKYKGGAKGFNYVFYRTEDAPIDKRYVDGVSQDLKASPSAPKEVPYEAPLTPHERVVQDIIDVGTEVSPKAARGTAEALSDSTASVAEQTAKGTSDAPVGRAPGAAVPQAEMPDGTLAPADAVARTQEVASQQRGFVGVGKEKAAKAHRFFTELVSEYEKLTAGIPAVRAFLSNLLDDPLRRTGLIGDNASSRFRENTLKANYEMQQYETAVSAYLRETTGVGPLRSLFGFSQKYTDSRLALEDELYGIMLQRHQAYTAGKTVPKANNPKLQELVEVLEEVTHGSAQRSKEDGLHGMQGYERSPGYVHRAWNYEKMVRYQNAYGTPFVIQMLEASARKGLPEASVIEVKAIAKAIYDRTMDKAQGARSDFMGQLGKTESDGILELLKLGGTDDTIIESVRRRLETLGQDKTGVKYVRDRLPLDMTLRFNAPDGSIVRMQDLVDTDISRLLENYQQSMAGRGALAHVGIGGDEAGLATFMNKYRKLLDTQDLTPAQKTAMQQQLEHVVGDFTGIRPDSAVLSPTMSFLKSTATAAMLGSTGVLQVAESSVVAARNGAMSTFKHMLSTVPGLRTLMQEVGSSTKLHESFTYATKLDFSTDTRIRSWKGQHEVGLVQDSSWQRLAYAQQQLVPTLTAQRWVHKQQSNMLLNQNLHTLWRASKGDADAIQQVKGFGYLTDAHLERFKQIEDLTPKGKLADLRLGILSDEDSTLR